MSEFHKRRHALYAEFPKEAAYYESEYAALAARLADAEAKIDALMLEYCPDEMTQEQVDRWMAHQVAADSAPAVQPYKVVVNKHHAGLMSIVAADSAPEGAK